MISIALLSGGAGAQGTPQTVELAKVDVQKLSAGYRASDPVNCDTSPRDSGIHVLGGVELLNGWARPSIGVVGRADPGENRSRNRGRSHRVIARLVTRS